MRPWVLAAVGAALHCASATASFNSFGSGPLCRDAHCVLWVGSLLGIAGVPVCGLIFAVLSLVTQRRGVSGFRAGWVIGNGVLAYALSVGLLLVSPAGDVSWIYAFVAYAAVFAMASVLIDRGLSR